MENKQILTIIHFDEGLIQSNINYINTKTKYIFQKFIKTYIKAINNLLNNYDQILWCRFTNDKFYKNDDFTTQLFTNKINQIIEIENKKYDTNIYQANYISTHILNEIIYKNEKITGFKIDNLNIDFIGFYLNACIANILYNTKQNIKNILQKEYNEKYTYIKTKDNSQELELIIQNKKRYSEQCKLKINLLLDYCFNKNFLNNKIELEKYCYKNLKITE